MFYSRFYSILLEPFIEPWTQFIPSRLQPWQLSISNSLFKSIKMLTKFGLDWSFAFVVLLRRGVLTNYQSLQNVIIARMYAHLKKIRENFHLWASLINLPWVKLARQVRCSRQMGETLHLWYTSVHFGCQKDYHWKLRRSWKHSLFDNRSVQKCTELYRR